MYAGQDSCEIDFTIPAFHQEESPHQPFEAMSYSEALYYIRFYMQLQLPWSGNSLATQVNSSSYSVHGLKTTLLSWAAQANLPEEDRRLHGKHKASQTSVQLYSRDDIMHVLFGTKMIALLLGCNGVLHVLQSKWNCCNNWVGFSKR